MATRFKRWKLPYEDLRLRSKAELTTRYFTLDMTVEIRITSGDQAFGEFHAGRFFVGVHGESLEHVRAEGRTERDVGGVAPACHQDATDTRNVASE